MGIEWSTHHFKGNWIGTGVYFLKDTQPYFQLMQTDILSEKNYLYATCSAPTSRQKISE